MADIVNSSFAHVNPKRHYIFDLPDEERADVCREDFWVPHPAATSLIQN